MTGLLLANLFSLAQWMPLLAIINLTFALPLIVSVSLVCAATRQEEMRPILVHAFRFGIWVMVFMGGVMIALTLLEKMA